MTTPAGLSPARAVLDNGGVILVKHTRMMPAVTIHLAVRAGSVCDPPDAPGAMYLLSRVIDRGTAARSSDQIAEELDSRGVSLTTAVTRHVFSLTCSCLQEDFEPVLALLGEILTAPSCPDPEIATRKGEVITAIRQDEDNPAVRALETLMALLYPDPHPYGRRAKGDVAAVEQLTRERIVGLHQTRFAPSELIAIIVGNVEAARAADLAGRVFGDWRKSPPPTIVMPHVSPAASRRRNVIPMMNKAQADVAYGFTTIARSDPEYDAFRVMNNAVGQYAIGGRIGHSIRERQGMAYYVGSSFDAGVVEGPLIVRAGVSAANVDRTIASIDEELEGLVRDGLTEKELTESQQFLVGSLPRTLETNAGIARFLESVEFFGLGLDYDVRLPDLIRAVTLDEVRAAARRALDPGRATIVVAGPYTEP